MTEFDAHFLKELGEFEQDMATGLDNEGHNIVMKNIKTKLIDMCKDFKIGVVEKLRLVMIYVTSQSGIEEASRKELIKSVDPRLQKAIRNLDKLGVDVTTVAKKSQSKHSKGRMDEFKKRATTIPLALMRYIPSLHNHCSLLAEDKLEDEYFPYTQAPPPKEEGERKERKTGGRSARKKATRNWRDQAKDDKKAEEDPRPLLMVFVLGGMTFSEMRSMYEIADAQNANIIIGSTSTLTSQEFIKGLADLGDDEYNGIVNDKPVAGAKSRRAADSDSDEEEEEPKDKKGKKDKDKKIGIKIDRL